MGISSDCHGQCPRNDAEIATAYSLAMTVVSGYKGGQTLIAQGFKCVIVGNREYHRHSRHLTSNKSETSGSKNVKWLKQ